MRMGRGASFLCPAPSAPQARADGPGWAGTTKGFRPFVVPSRPRRTCETRGLGPRCLLGACPTARMGTGQRQMATRGGHFRRRRRASIHAHNCIPHAVTARVAIKTATMARASHQPFIEFRNAWPKNPATRKLNETTMSSMRFMVSIGRSLALLEQGPCARSVDAPEVLDELPCDVSKVLPDKARLLDAQLPLRCLEAGAVLGKVPDALRPIGAFLGRGPSAPQQCHDQCPGLPVVFLPPEQLEGAFLARQPETNNVTP